MKLKRISAKFIDFVLLLALEVGTTMGIIIGINYYSNIKFDFSIITNVQENRLDVIMLIGIIIIIGLVVQFIYFGLIGKLLNGSPGKYAMKIYIDPTNKNVLNPIKLFIREPIVFTQLLNSAILLTIIVIPQLLVLNLLTTVFNIMIFTYFLTNNDFWNNKLKMEITK